MNDSLVMRSTKTAFFATRTGKDSQLLPPRPTSTFEHFLQPYTTRNILNFSCTRQKLDNRTIIDFVHGGSRCHLQMHINTNYKYNGSVKC